MGIFLLRRFLFFIFLAVCSMNASAKQPLDGTVHFFAGYPSIVSADAGFRYSFIDEQSLLLSVEPGITSYWAHFGWELYEGTSFGASMNSLRFNASIGNFWGFSKFYQPGSFYSGINVFGTWLAMSARLGIVMRNTDNSLVPFISLGLGV